MAKKPTKAQLQSAFRKNLSVLKKKGLTKVNVRTAKPTKHLKSLIKKNRDVISGRAAVVKISGRGKRQMTQKEARVRARIVAEQVGGRAKGGRVIIEAPGKNVRYNPRTGDFTSETTKAGKKVRVRIILDKKDFYGLQKEGFSFSVPLGNTFRHYTDAKEMIADMNLYEVGRNPYKNWQRYVIVNRREEMQDEEEE